MLLRLDLLKKHKGTEAIQGIIFGGFKYDSKVEEVTFTAESFKGMSRLRFLYLNSVNLTGSFEQAFTDLRWLRWVYCPMTCLPPEFHPHKLVILELPHSKMKTMWERNMVFEKLKTLDMRNSQNLITTPDFTILPCLETLNLSGCSSLKEVHISIGSLERLVSLDLMSCTDLRSLPDNICSLRTLEVLDITYCSKLEKIPDQLGEITSLRELRARAATQLKMIPDISQLSNIEYLDLSDCYHLLSIVELPPNLDFIYPKGCRSLVRLPNISNLKQLKELKLTDCSSLREIPELPPNLKLIEVWCCMSLERLPNLSNLKHLEELKLIDCSSLTELQGLEELTSLKSLRLWNCVNLLSMSEFAPNLISKAWRNSLV